MNKPIIKITFLWTLLFIFVFLGVIYRNNRLDIVEIIINLIPELIGIIITVVVIQQVLEGQEKQRRRNIEKRAIIETEIFIAMSLGKLLKINRLRDKVKIGLVIQNIEQVDLSDYIDEIPYEHNFRMDLAQKYDIKLDPSLIISNLGLGISPNIYVQKFLEEIPEISEYEELDKCINKGIQSLTLFKDYLAPEVFDYFFLSINEITEIKLNQPRLISVLNNVINSDRSEFEKSSTKNSICASLATMNGKAVQNLYTLYKLVNAIDK